MPNTIISVGDTYRIFDSSVRTYDSLPVGTYTINFSQMEGFSLSQVIDLAPPTTKVYGNREAKVAKIVRAYNSMDRSLGVLLSGDKGQGKSMFLRMVADEFIKSGLPVVRVTQNYPGVADFIDSLGECVVVFDEFEKVFSKSDNEQDQFLPMFDGVSSVKRLYCVTINDVYRVSDYMVNRPGRFHYHLRFDYPTKDEIRDYVGDEVASVTDEQVASILNFADRVNINYDHLRAIAFELNMDPSGQVSEIVEDLNIKPMGSDSFTYRIAFEKGKMFKREASVSPFTEDTVSIWLEVPGLYEKFTFSTDNIRRDESKNVFFVDGANLSHEMDAEDLEKFGNPVRMEISVKGQQRYSYGAF